MLIIWEVGLGPLLGSGKSLCAQMTVPALLLSLLAWGAPAPRVPQETLLPALLAFLPLALLLTFTLYFWPLFLLFVLCVFLVQFKPWPPLFLGFALSAHSTSTPSSHVEKIICQLEEQETSIPAYSVSYMKLAVCSSK